MKLNKFTFVLLLITHYNIGFWVILLWLWFLNLKNRKFYLSSLLDKYLLLIKSTELIHHCVTQLVSLSPSVCFLQNLTLLKNFLSTTKFQSHREKYLRMTSGKPPRKDVWNKHQKGHRVGYLSHELVHFSMFWGCFWRHGRWKNCYNYLRWISRIYS